MEQYEWTNQGEVIAVCDTLPELMTVMEKKKYLLPSFGKMQDTLDHADEFEYASGMFKVKRVKT